MSLGGVTTVSLPNCERLGCETFYSCSNLTTIYMPKLSTIIDYSTGYFGYSAFGYCSKLSSAELPMMSNIPSYTFLCCSNLSHISMPNLEKVGYYTFCSTGLLSVDLPKVWALPPQYAFGYCKSLSIVNLPNCLGMSDYVFCGCDKISSLNVPKCAAIRGGCFTTNSVITSLSFPRLVVAGNRNYGGDAFGTMSNLQSVYMPNLYSIQGGTIGNLSNIPYLSFPYLLQYYGPLNQLVSQGVLSLPIVNSTFWINNCASLTSINLPGVSAIANVGGMYNNANLTTVSMPGLISMSSGGGFMSCTKLEEICLPQVNILGAGAFSWCTSLRSVILLRKSISLTDANLFYKTPISDSSYLGYFGSIYFPSQYVDYYKTANNWSRYSSRIAPIPNQESYDAAYAYESEFTSSTITEIPASKSSIIATLPYAFASCASLLEINLPECTLVGSNTFLNCSSVSSMSLPKLQVIQYSAFTGCRDLQSISLPEVTHVGPYAFAYCSSLTYIHLPKCKQLDFDAFASCYKISGAYLPECIRLSTYAFGNCSNLRWIVLRDIKYFEDWGYGAAIFSSCAKLISVYLLGSCPIPLGGDYGQIGDGRGTTFYSTPIAAGSGKIYVRESLLSDWIAMTSVNYRSLSSHFVGIPDEEADAILENLDNGGTL